MPSSTSSSELKRFLGRLAAFGLVTVAALVLIDRSLPPYWGSPLYAAKIEWWEGRPAGTFNTLFMGSSRMYRHVDPAIFDPALPGSRSFNLGVSGMYGFETLRNLEVLLAEGHLAGVERVFIDVCVAGAIREENLHLPESYYYLDGATTWAAISFYLGQPQDYTRDAWRFGASYLDNLLKVGARLVWIDRRFAAVDAPTKEAIPRDRGFQALTELRDADRQRMVLLAERMLVEREEAARRELTRGQRIYLELLEQAIARGRDAGIEVIPVLMPGVLGHYPILRQLPPGRWLDLADPGRYPDFYRERYQADLSHLNAEGARLFSRALAEAYRDRPGGR